MRTLARPIGLGLAARGDVEDVVDWSRRARDAGLDSVWIHDSYYERDAVSFGSAVAAAIGRDGDGGLVEGEAGFRVALGALNPHTRHPVVLAMTGSALDEMLPGRIVLGIGTGLPLRLRQMGIPYEPDAAARSSLRSPDRRRTATSPARPSRSRACAAFSSGSARRRSKPVEIQPRSRRPAISCRSSTPPAARPSTGPSASRS